MSVVQEETQSELPSNEADVPELPAEDVDVVDLPTVDVEVVELPTAKVAEVAELPTVEEALVSEPPEGLFARVLTLAFGSVGLLAGLSLLATIPVAQFMTLGWLLEAEGRLARGGSWRTALPGLRKAARIGSSVLGCLILLLPFLILQSVHRDATLLTTPEAAAGIGLFKAVLGILLGGHALLAIARGGKLRYFFWPPGNLWWLGKKLVRGELPSPGDAWARTARWIRELRLPHYLVLGVKGFLVGAAWLALPTTLLVLSKNAPPLALLGMLSLPLILPYALVAQARVAAEQDVRAGFRWGEIRKRLKRAPLALVVALVVTLGLALPLYAFKVEVLPRDALWLPAGFFLLAALPGRLLSGWAHARGSREGRAHWSLRVLGFGLCVPAGGFYVFLVFFTQYFGWRGATGLYAQHAFLLPVAFY